MSSSGNPPPDNPQFELPLDQGGFVPAVSVSSDSFAAPSPLLPPLPVVPPPVRDPVWSGWDVLLIAVLTFLTMVVLQVIVIVAARLFLYPAASWADVAQKPVLALVAQFLAYILVAIFMVLLVEGKYRVRLWQAIRWNWPQSQWQLLGIGLAMMIALGMLEVILPLPKSVPFDRFFQRPLDAYLTSIFAVTLGPFMEELFFRGFLYPVVARRLGVLWGVILTALLFALLHSFQLGNAWSAVLVIFIVGVVLTTVRAVTKSVGASFLVHVGYNGALMVTAAIASHGFRHMERVGLLLQGWPR